jgi:hypothetical protein
MPPIENNRNNSFVKKIVKLSQEQIWMLQMSKCDIARSKLISQSDLDNDDLKWLKTLSTRL